MYINLLYKYLNDVVAYTVHIGLFSYFASHNDHNYGSIKNKNIFRRPKSFIVNRDLIGNQDSDKI